MKRIQRQSLSLAVELVFVLGAHYILWVWISNQEIAARLLAAGDHLPRLELAAAVVFLIARFFALFLLPGVVLLRLTAFALDAWGPRPGLEAEEVPTCVEAGPFHISHMILLFDIGNTNTHLGLADGRRVRRHADISTAAWLDGSAVSRVIRFVGRAAIEGCALCSVVPRATSRALKAVRRQWKLDAVCLTPATVRGIGIRYPKPATLGPDRLANAIAAHAKFGAPVVAVDFGTAVTFDVVDARGDFVGGIIAPGIAVMTEYLHEKTALLPRIRIREVNSVIGKSTEEAMTIAAVHGYRGLIQGLLIELKRELKSRRLPVVATGGYAQLMAARLQEITAIEPTLTLEGLRLTWIRVSKATAGKKLIIPKP